MRGRRRGQATWRSIRRGSRRAVDGAGPRADSRSRSGATPDRQSTGPRPGQPRQLRQLRVGAAPVGVAASTTTSALTGGGGVHDIGGRQVGPEIEHVGAGGGGEDRAAQQTELVRARPTAWRTTAVDRSPGAASVRSSPPSTLRTIAETRCSCAGRIVPLSHRAPTSRSIGSTTEKISSSAGSTTAWRLRRLSIVGQLIALQRVEQRREVDVRSAHARAVVPASCRSFASAASEQAGDPANGVALIDERGELPAVAATWRRCRRGRDRRARARPPRSGAPRRAACPATGRSSSRRREWGSARLRHGRASACVHDMSWTNMVTTGHCAAQRYSAVATDAAT